MQTIPGAYSIEIRPPYEGTAYGDVPSMEHVRAMFNGSAPDGFDPDVFHGAGVIGIARGQDDPVPDVVQFLRKQQGMGLTQLARTAGLGLQTVKQMIKREVVRPWPRKVAKMLGAVGVKGLGFVILDGNSNGGSFVPINDNYAEVMGSLLAKTLTHGERSSHRSAAERGHASNSSTYQLIAAHNPNVGAVRLREAFGVENMTVMYLGFTDLAPDESDTSHR